LGPVARGRGPDAVAPEIRQSIRPTLRRPGRLHGGTLPVPRFSRMPG